MIIKRVLTNNVVIAEIDGTEKIYCGKGIGYAKKKGDVVEGKRIEKCFVLETNFANNNFENLIKDIPFEYLQVVKSYLRKAEQDLNTKFSDIFFLTLTDHIFGAVLRSQLKPTPPPLQNPFLQDLKTFYKKEFKVALKLNQFIKKINNIQFSEDEIGFIALYFISGLVCDLNENKFINKIVNQILQIIRLTLQVEFDTDSSVYNRLLVHLRYFAMRLSNNEHLNTDIKMMDFITGIKQNFPLPYKAAKKIKNFLALEYQYEIEESELIYLTIHICRILDSCNY